MVIITKKPTKPFLPNLRSVWLPLLGLVLFLLLPYVYIFPFVGEFAAERIDTSLKGSAARSIMCNKHNNESKRPAERGETSLNNGDIPEISVSTNNAWKFKKLIERNSTLYYSADLGKLFAIDALSQSDRALLNFLEEKGLIKNPEKLSFLRTIKQKYTPCLVEGTDRGATEAYWAAKGTSALHHWVHLYAAIHSTHAQYGYIIPYTANFLSKELGIQGPTGFAKVSWIALSFIGAAYLIIFIQLFSPVPKIAVLAALLKISLFFNLGSFAILMAPGFHWTREFVVILIGLFCGTRLRSFFPINRENWRTNLFLVFFVLSFCYFLDQTFFLLSVFSFVGSLCWIYYDKISDFVKARRGLSFLTFLTATIFGAVLIGANKTLVSYILEKSIHHDHGLFSLSTKISLIAACILFGTTLIVWNLKNRKDCHVVVYFGLASICSYFYFFITPDNFHFIKFIEYSVPFGAAYLMHITQKTDIRISTIQNVVIFAKSGFAQIVLIIVIVGFGLNGLFGKTEPQLSLFDEYHQPAYETNLYLINNRQIKANISPETAGHLQQFANHPAYKYIISPFDKYILFLYDAPNGFGTPDLTAALDSQSKLDKAIDAIGATNSIVVVDYSSLIVDPTDSIGKRHNILGGLFLSPAQNVKARIRLLELASAIRETCSEIKAEHRGDWHVFQCHNAHSNRTEAKD